MLRYRKFQIHKYLTSVYKLAYYLYKGAIRFQDDL